jgi:hypothetical protein
LPVTTDPSAPLRRQFPERGWHDGRVTINKRIAAGRRERRALVRVSRAAWRLEQAERERTWALVSARAEGISIRTLASAAGLSASRVHQIVAGADLDALDAALGELRQQAGQPPRIQTSGRTPNSAAGTPSPAGYPMRWAGCGSARTGSRTWTLMATRQGSACARPPTGRPGPSWPSISRVRAVIDRIAADVDQLARARRVQDLNTAAVLPDPRTERPGGWPSRTWTSGPSAPGGGCPLPRPATGAGLGRLAG